MGSQHEYELPQRSDAKAWGGAGCFRDGGIAVVVFCRIRNRGGGSAAGAMEGGYLDPVIYRCAVLAVIKEQR